MIGVFDSGLDGLAVVNRIRQINKDIDIAFFADYENAPYGTKSKDILISLVKNDIRLLKDFNADKILIGCCTASTVYNLLSEEEKALSVPIITPCAIEAKRRTKNNKIGVIATRATIASHAFESEICKNNGYTSYEFETQDLVGIVESGLTDRNMDKSTFKRIYEIIRPLKTTGIDTLILGCTHFDWLFRSIGECLPGVSVVSSPIEGAREITRIKENEKGCADTHFVGSKRGYKNGKIQTRKN